MFNERNDTPVGGPCGWGELDPLLNVVDLELHLGDEFIAGVSAEDMHTAMSLLLPYIRWDEDPRDFTIYRVRRERLNLVLGAR